MKRLLLSAFLLSGSLGTLPAQSFFTSPAAQFLTPAWRTAAETEFSHWDVFYSPNEHLNYPDTAAPYGSGQLASEANFTPPPDASPGDPYAFWDLRNPTLRQTVPGTAFIIGPGATGNIYSFSAVTAYELADTTPFAAGSVVMQFQTDGTLLDFSSLQLVAGGIAYAPTNFITEYQSSGSSFGGITNRSAAQWDLTGLGTTAYKITFHASGSSNSFQELLLDTTATYAEAVPSARTWNAPTGNWSGASNWSSGLVPSAGGNITVASGSSLTVDGGTRTIGELNLSAAGAFTIGASGGGSLKINTGITATPASSTTYTINAPVELGAYSLIALNAATTLEFGQSLSSAVGIYFSGPGRMRWRGNTSLGGAVTVAGGTLEIGPGASFSGSGAVTVVSGGTLLVHGTLGGSGALNFTSGTLGGNGILNRTLRVGPGNLLAPGAGVGTLTTVGETWTNGGHFQLELTDAEATPGTGWDLLKITGALDLLASAGGFTLELRTRDTSGADGLFQHFDPTRNYAWKFASTTTGITNFDAADFTIDATAFQNALAGGSFHIAQSDAALFLQFQAVPEPCSPLLLGSGALLLNRRRYRRQTSTRRD